jgi:hypothetical protein
MNFRHLIGFIFCRDFGGAQASTCAGDGCCASQVMNGPKATSELSPFDPQLRTLVGAARRSHSCHKRPNQTFHLARFTVRLPASSSCLTLGRNGRRRGACGPMP